MDYMDLLRKKEEFENAKRRRGENMEATLAYKDLSAIDCRHGIFSKEVFYNCTFVNADFRYSMFDNCKFVRCNFTNADFQYCKFTDCVLDNNEFTFAKFMNTDWITTEIIGNRFDAANFYGIHCIETNFRDGCFEEAKNLGDNMGLVKNFSFSAIERRPGHCALCGLEFVDQASGRLDQKHPTRNHAYNHTRKSSNPFCWKCGGLMLAKVEALEFAHDLAYPDSIVEKIEWAKTENSVWAVMARAANTFDLKGVDTGYGYRMAKAIKEFIRKPIKKIKF